MSVVLCPYCGSDVVEYDSDLVAGEREWWGCLACHRAFFVDIEIVRGKVHREEELD